jgi:hypothetical protein
MRVQTTTTQLDHLKRWPTEFLVVRQAQLEYQRFARSEYLRLLR